MQGKIDKLKNMKFSNIPKISDPNSFFADIISAVPNIKKVLFNDCYLNQAMANFTSFFMLFKFFLQFSVKFENHLKQNPIRNSIVEQNLICPKPKSEKIQEDAETQNYPKLNMEDPAVIACWLCNGGNDEANPLNHPLCYCYSSIYHVRCYSESLFKHKFRCNTCEKICLSSKVALKFLENFDFTVLDNPIADLFFQRLCGRTDLFIRKNS